jgi:hypothetical protein
MRGIPKAKVRGSEDLWTLEAKLRDQGHGLTENVMAQTRVRLEHLYVAPRAFQPRTGRENPEALEAHIRSLAETIRRTDDVLDHIEVLSVAGTRYVVDGHCRLAAYYEAGWPGSREVAVRHLKEEGVDGAYLRVGQTNVKDKLAWTQADKSEYAWGLLARSGDPRRGNTKWTQGEIARMAGVSIRTVSRMAGTLRDLLGAYEIVGEFDWMGPEPLRMTWQEALEWRKGNREPNDDWRDHVEREIEQHLRPVTKLANKYPDIFAGVFERMMPKVLEHHVESRVADLEERFEKLQRELVSTP